MEVPHRDQAIQLIFHNRRTRKVIRRRSLLQPFIEQALNTFKQYSELQPKKQRKFGVYTE